ncbi:MAG: putative 2-aminoethylphosphonate ABC transporter ATP-binding protein [Rhodospirillaceae bacterium]|jgi:iron(III) transport system ATP-binding protein
MTERAPYLKVDHISKHYGDFAALRDVSFEIYEGEFICFLGPSGCGKTTLLRCISGLEEQSAGTISQNGIDISTEPVSKRDFGIVFQSYALFPNLTVWQNVCYGLANAKVDRAKGMARAEELLELVGMTRHKPKYPAQLSGGEQQRIALVRALTTAPGLLLLDEPLSALDAKVRTHLRHEIKNLQKALGVTTIMVTHDQEEAQSMADRVLVMRSGRLEQIGTPREIYDSPKTRFIADFIGIMNFVPATVEDRGRVVLGGSGLACDTKGRGVGAPVDCAFRPEDVLLANSAIDGDALPATVDVVEHLGAFERVLVRLDGLDAVEVTVDLRKGSDASAIAIPGATVFLHVAPENILLFEPVGQP